MLYANSHFDAIIDSLIMNTRRFNLSPPAQTIDKTGLNLFALMAR